MRRVVPAAPEGRHGPVIGNTLLLTVARPSRKPWECAVAEPRFSLETRGGSVVASVHGELDVTSSKRFDDLLSDAAARGDRVILDMSGVDFMDTTALAVIVGHWRRQVADGGEFLLAGARYRYTKTLWITGLADRLPMYGTVEEALAAQTGPGAGAGSGHDAREEDEPGATAG
jgi:anti-sigma B factor antagonist